MRFTIAKRIGAAVASATVIAGAVSLLILREVIRIHDSLVSSRFTGVEQELRNISGASRTWIAERKRLLALIGYRAFEDLESQARKGASFPRAVRNLSGRYPELTEASLFSSGSSILTDALPAVDIPVQTMATGLLSGRKCRAVNRFIPQWGRVRLTLCTDVLPITIHNAATAALDRARAMDRIQEELRPYYYFIVTLGSVGGAIFAIFAAWLLVRRMVREIRELSEASWRVARGDVSVRVNARGDDELGELERDFNHMVEELESYRRRISYLERMGAWQEVARRLAHEIKNPLTPIVLMMDQIREKAPREPESFRRLVDMASEVVRSEVETLRRLVETFGQLARLPEPRMEPMDLRELLASLQDTYRASGHDIITLGVPGQPVVVDGDRDLLRRALSNMLDNAIEAEATEIEVSLDVVYGRAVLRVRDNGSGIPEGAIEHVFEPYFTTKQTGTGLGLALVRKVALDHDGDVRVVPHNGPGTVMEMWIPVKA